MNILQIFRQHWLVFAFLFGTGLRFFDLNWDGLFKLHPDELNIAIAVSNMGKNQHFNPDFFAYGTLPIALIFGIKSVIQIFFEISLNEYLIGRVISATLSSVSILIFYKWVKLLFINNNLSEQKLLIPVSTILFALSPALIQAAHSMTFESILIFEYLVIAYLLTKLINTNKGSTVNLVSIAIVTGTAIATKITSIFLIPLFLTTLLLSANYKFQLKKELRLILKKVSIFIIITIFVALVLSPYSLLYWDDYSSIIKYENQVANGNLRVFYTKQFNETIPIVYHLKNVLPFVLGNWINIFLSFAGLVTIIKLKKNNKNLLLVPLLFLLIGWLPSTFLFVKWIRYSTYFAPFLLVFTSVGFLYFVNKINSKKILITTTYLIINLLLVLNFLQVYLYEDTRVTAAKWAEKNIFLGDNRILSESYDLGIIPFNNKFMDKIDLFNFYDLNNDQRIYELANYLSKSQYIISPSQRLWANIELSKDVFLRNYYLSLQNGSLGFELIYTSRVKTSSGWIGYDPMKLEETYSVFDHPIVNIYKKTKNIDVDKYIELIKDEN